jgi:hypothetical protein
MKTKTLLLLCLLSGIGLTQLSAQNGKNGTGSTSEFDVWDAYWIPVFSPDGNQIDLLEGWATMHNVFYYKDGVWLWRRQQFSGEAVSVGIDRISGTGEVFRIMDTFTGDVTTSGVSGGGHVNAKGDKGSHYIIFYEYQYNESTGGEIVTFVKAVSPGSKK